MHRVKGKRTCGMFLNTNLPTVLKKPAPNKKVRTELDMICTTNVSRRCLAFYRYVKNPIYRDTNSDVNQEILAPGSRYYELMPSQEGFEVFFFLFIIYKYNAIWFYRSYLTYRLMSH